MQILIEAMCKTITHGLHLLHQDIKCITILLTDLVTLQQRSGESSLCYQPSELTPPYEQGTRYVQAGLLVYRWCLYELGTRPD